MKKIAFMIALTALVGCGQKSTHKADLGQDGEELEEMEDDDVAETGDSAEFDISKYIEKLQENPGLRISMGDPVPTEYALIDLDGDGKNELWVRGENNYEALYTLENDGLGLIAYADGATDLTFYKNAVGYSAYYTPGHSYSGAQIVKNSSLAEYYDEQVDFDINSDEMEVFDEFYRINGEEATDEECDAFQKKLGDPVDAPQAKWQPIY